MKLRFTVFQILLSLLLFSSSGLCVEPVVPWPEDTPEHHGLDREALNNWQTHLAKLGTKALLVVRDDKVVYEWYAPGTGPNDKQGTASLAKAVIGGSSLMFAIADGHIHVQDHASQFIPAWRSDPLKSKITIAELATHTSGIEDAEQDGISHAKLSGWKGAFWRRNPDPFSIAIHDAPVIFPPGTAYEYSNPGMAALSYAITASLKGAPQTDVRSLLKARLLDPLEIPESQWSIGYNTPYHVDDMDLYANWGGAAFSPRALARIGQLMLHEGEWHGKRLVPRSIAQKMVSYSGMPIQKRTPSNPGPASGLCWWINFDGVWPDVPRDAFAGAGAGQQILLVVPSLNLIVVRNGAGLGQPNEFWRSAVNEVIRPAARLAHSRSPYPPSPIIRKVSFAPASTIERRAIDSDNWPLTWGDDDAQYASYGDGEGFEPFLKEKLSLGFAKIIGSATAFRGINIRSTSGERKGDGAKGAKASGMLMVNGILYLWVRNTGNSQLAWSDDHGNTWHWGFHFTTSFGSPTFLNFGRNYAGARDGFVYTYSQDGPSAYKSDDALVLARAPKASLRDRSAYEFFKGLDNSGSPVWTKDINARKPVFQFPGHCGRSDVVYNPLLKRFLLALGYNERGGWGIFDAANPWGPWTTVFHTDYWGLGGTHSYRLPAKWIGPAADRMTVVFSGVALPDISYDAFCTREIAFTLNKIPSAERLIH